MCPFTQDLSPYQDNILLSSSIHSTTMAFAVGLRDQRVFPVFDTCPGEGSIDFDYYSTEDGFIFRPTRHWCLLAEIAHTEYFIRLRLYVRDKSGQEFPIAFHLDKDEKPGLEQFQKGHTIALLYPHRHGFLDMTIGIRHEVMENMLVRILRYNRPKLTVIGYPTSFV